ncbi:hypothetical protein L596_009154 [Steinernema carpocapsae]|uniref:DUF8206 domain-containing protein n=1 Tax=Steinernema carpocapsae TaxID=34508 RepID=A0A4V6A6H5_STECR|nr:hypothetical protein L596_009154 [Steinernema carpocapsae]
MATSWKESAQSCFAVLDYAHNIEPHNTREMISLNEAKRVILQLIPISGVITQNIQVHHNTIEGKKKELQQLEQQTIFLKSRLNDLRVSLETIPLKHPRTVCTSQKCAGQMQIPGTEHTQTTFRVCHDPCKLKNVDESRFPNPSLRKCNMMSKDGCAVCGCSWEKHRYVRFLQRQVVEEVENDEIKRLIESTNDEQVATRAIIKSYEQHLSDWKEIENRIMVICAKFVVFFRSNAIAAVNDAYEEYLKDAIKIETERSDPADPASAAKVDQLEKYLEDYKREVETQTMNVSSGYKTTADDIDDMKRELMEMKFVGSQLKRFVEVMDKSERTNERPGEQHFPSPEEEAQSKKTTKAGGSGLYKILRFFR